jgi:hypothetical protein
MQGNVKANNSSELMIDPKQLESVEYFKYLGCLI